MGTFITECETKNLILDVNAQLYSFTKSEATTCDYAGCDADWDWNTESINVIFENPYTEKSTKFNFKNLSTKNQDLILNALDKQFIKEL
jgi:hypothetical protein